VFYFQLQRAALREYGFSGKELKKSIFKKKEKEAS
jgi:hypothetical protein